MIINNTEELTDKRFKVIIVGSGIAGISIATRLEKYGIESLVIEAGDYEFDDDSNKYLKSNLSVIIKEILQIIGLDSLVAHL